MIKRWISPKIITALPPSNTLCCILTIDPKGFPWLDTHERHHSVNNYNSTNTIYHKLQPSSRSTQSEALRNSITKNHVVFLHLHRRHGPPQTARRVRSALPLQDE